MSFEDYNKWNKRLQSIYYLDSPTEEIAINLHLMYKALEDELVTVTGHSEELAIKV